jgi:hypothetical protein
MKFHPDALIGMQKADAALIRQQVEAALTHAFNALARILRKRA